MNSNLTEWQRELLDAIEATRPAEETNPVCQALQSEEARRCGAVLARFASQDQGRCLPGELLPPLL